MKKEKLLLLIGILIVTNLSFAQNNTFPSIGNTGIGTTSPNSKLEVNGNVTFDSSLSVKKNINVNGNLITNGIVYTSRIISNSPDGLFHFGDSSLVFNDGFNQLFTNTSLTAGGII